jgi:hypothetical protein
VDEFLPQENAMKKTILLVLLALCLGLCLGAYAAQAPAPKPADLSGVWNGRTEVPEAGTDDLQLVLKKEKDGYSGTITDSVGMIAPATEIKILEIKGDAMTLTFPLVDGTVVVCKMKIAEDKIVGGWEHPSGSSGPMEFARKK